MTFDRKADNDETLLAWVTPGSPVSLAYEMGYSEGLAIAAAEVAKLRAEISDMRLERDLPIAA